MNENAKKWVEALRSGKYRQGKSYLSPCIDGVQYCCLGVACDLYLKAGFDLSEEWPDMEMLDGELRPVQEWLGLRTSSGSYKAGRDFTQELTSDNDNGKTFAEIADIIESEPEGLFVVPAPHAGE